MAKQAVYDGPYPAVIVEVDPVTKETVTVDRGGKLPDTVSAAIRDELLTTSDWHDPSKKKEQ